LGTSQLSPVFVSGWNYAGLFSFNAGSQGAVTVSDAFAAPGGPSFCIADAIMFRYNPTAPVLTRQPADLAVVEGNDAVLSVETTGSAPLACQWQFNRSNLSQATDAVLVLPKVDRTQAGFYRVLVSNADGSVYSREALLQVVAPPLLSRWDKGTLILDWQGAALLQAATNVSGPFVDMPGALPPVSVPNDEEHRFFRLAR
jgi:hypothetical protein